MNSKKLSLIASRSASGASIRKYRRAANVNKSIWHRLLPMRSIWRVTWAWCPTIHLLNQRVRHLTLVWWIQQLSQVIVSKVATKAIIILIGDHLCKNLACVRPTRLHMGEVCRAQPPAASVIEGIRDYRLEYYDLLVSQIKIIRASVQLKTQLLLLITLH